MPTQITQAVVSGVLMGGVYSLIAAGFTLVFGVMRIVNFAHGELVVAGMYTAFWLLTIIGINPVVAIAVAVAIVMLLGMVLHISVFRPLLNTTENMQMAATIGLSIILQNVALFLFSSDPKALNAPWSSDALTVGAVRLPAGRSIAFLASCIVLLLLYVALRFTELGKALRAAVDNRDGALLVGIPVGRLYGVAFVLGTLCAGVAGIVTLPFLFITPTAGLDFTMRSFAIVVLGGMGSISGAVLAAFLVGLVESLGTLFLPTSATVGLTFGILIITLLLRPSGLLGRSLQ